jgi:hypothetical protein
MEILPSTFFLNDVFTPRNMKNNIPPHDIDDVDVNEGMGDMSEDMGEELSTEPMPESEDMSTVANHSFPANTSRNSETRWKRKRGKIQALCRLLALEEKKN